MRLTNNLSSTLSNNRVYVGISSCLLGEKVRYDGGHKYNSYINEILSKYFDFIPCCPEIEIGLGVPRATINLQGTHKNPKAVISGEGRDITAALADYGRNIAISQTYLSAYIFKSGSPSCGLQHVNVYNKDDTPISNSPGIFAKAFIQHHTLLPMLDEDALQETVSRDNFIERVFLYHHWQLLRKHGLTESSLKIFHHLHNFLIPAGNDSTLNASQGLAVTEGMTTEKIPIDYITNFMQALNRQDKQLTRTDKFRYFVKCCEPQFDKRAQTLMVNTINNYQKNDLPIIVVLNTVYQQLYKLY